MLYYGILTAATLGIAAMAVLVWWKTRQIAFIIGFAFIYYWSLFGAWRVIARGLGSGTHYRFEYLYYKLFPIYLDEYYVWTIVLYAIFILTIQLTVLYVARHRSVPASVPRTRVRISHPLVLAMSSALMLVAYLIVRKVLAASFALDTPGYVLLNEAHVSVPLFSVYQIVHQTSLTFALTGFTVLLSGRRAKYIEGTPHAGAAIGYAVVLAAIVALNVMLGNRSMVLFGTVGAGLFYLANTQQPSKLLVAGGAVAAVSALVVLGIVRGTGGQREWATYDLTGKVRYAAGEIFAQDTETVAAHASLYGTLRHHVPLTYGSSFVWLVGAVVPRAFRIDLVPLTYFHYATHVGASPNQGFTLHHATGWYLNFGFPGLMVGGFVFAWLWARLYNAFHDAGGRVRSHFGQVFAIVAFWNFTAYSAILLRTGPEGYKGVIVECFLVPTLLLACASLKLIKRENRPRLVPAHTSRVA